MSLGNKWSLKWRLVVPVSVLIVVIMAGITTMLVLLGDSEISEFSGKVGALSESVVNVQRQRLDEIRQDNVNMMEKKLDEKGLGLGQVLAKLSKTSLTSFDYDPLDDACAMVCKSDSEVLICYVYTQFKADMIASKFKNEKHPEIAKLPQDQRQSVVALVETLQRTLIEGQEFRKFRVPVLDDGANKIGYVELLVSLKNIKDREKALTAQFDDLRGTISASFKEMKDKLEIHKTELRAKVTIQLLVISAAALLLAVCLLILQANAVVGPIEAAVAVAQRVAQGDLTVKVDGISSNGATNETGQLLTSVKVMTENLDKLVSQVKHSSIQLVTTATTIASNVKQQKETVSDFGTSTTEITAAAKEISATSKELLNTVTEVTQGAKDTADLADSGRTNLREMEETIGQLGQATTSIASKLSAIREKADEINLVVTTITKVADQTNLLSLNAAIEAEKAGEYGQGFAVVAREIRRLADQTAVATLDIEQMVKEMQAAVTTGVMEMDRFAQEVRNGVQKMNRIGTQQGQIIERVQAFIPRFQNVNESMHAQSAGAQQISDAMVQLNEGAQRLVGGLAEFEKAAETLYSAVNGLKGEVTRFKVSA